MNRHIQGAGISMEYPVVLVTNSAAEFASSRTVEYTQTGFKSILSRTAGTVEQGRLTTFASVKREY
jgi:hypothetical protein